MTVPPEDDGSLYRGNSADGSKWMAAEIAELKKRLRALEGGGAPLKQAGIRVREDGLTVESSLSVTGDLSATGDTEIGGSLDVTGDAAFSGDTTIGGNASIVGTLSLPNGIIDNDALANPVQFAADFDDIDNPTITTTETDLASVSFVVPDGFTEAFVVGYASIGIVNPTGADSSIGGRVYVDRPNGQGSVWGPRRFQFAPAGSDSACYPYKQTNITGLSGGETITVRLVGLNAVGGSWGVTPGGASMNAHVYFTR